MEQKQKTRSVAIVGFAFRLPGTDTDSLWDALCEGRNLVNRVEEGRFGQDACFHPNKSEPGTSYTFAAGSVGPVDGFDAAFFGISPREAAQMDPQQRLLLELAWEALEDGGIRPSSLRGSRSGVFIGYSASDYSYRRVDDFASFDAYTMTGSTASIAANRISYVYDLKGPSMVIDTACSSSLVAFHQACQSIVSGECPLAFAGGISLHLHPLAFIGFSKASMLSRQGACQVFDAAADGYVRSEGGGLFVLKDLEAARADGDRIWAVVAGTGINCDGRTNGLTVPGGEAQAGLLREVYASAGIDPDALDYVEAHGTGTAVGDPIETRALGEALGSRRRPGSPLPIGSVKSNLGHLEAASGVAGLVKALFCIQHRAIPPTIHLEIPNPAIRFEEWNLQPVTRLTRLDPRKALVVGVNSFGFGGANAHVILASAPTAAAEAARPAEAGPLPPLFVSGRSPAALRAAAGRYAALLAGRGESDYYEIAHGAAFQRDFHEFRAVAFGPGPTAVAAALADFAEGREAPAVAEGKALKTPSEAAFVYSGNGAQWAGMAQALLAEDGTFRVAVEAVDALFAPEGGFSIVEELKKDADSARLDQTEIGQPLLFAVQVGLTEMLRARGLRPAAVAGHSVGEVAAAWAAGALSLEQAVRVITIRSREQGTTRGDWGMTALGLGQAAATELLQGLGLDDRITLAGLNSPAGITLAGRRADLDALETALAGRDVFVRRLGLDYAFHSPAMDVLEPRILAGLKGLTPAAGEIPFVSTVTGGELDGTGLDARYWWRNIREPVRFESAIRGLLGKGIRVFVEMGPHAVLRGYVNEILRSEGAEGRAVATLLRGDDRPGLVDKAFAEAVIAGAPFEARALFPAAGRRVDLPRYPWQRQRYWHPVTAEAYGLIDRRKEHPLLGYRLSENAGQWENHLDTVLYPQYRDHVVGGAAVLPAAGFVEMALAASRLVHGGQSHEIEELEIRAPLLLDDTRARTVRFSLDNSDGSFTIQSRERLSDEPWLLNAVGRLPGNPAIRTAAEPPALPGRPPDCAGAEHYRRAERVGLAYGPAFRAVAEVWLEDGGVRARLGTPEAVAAEVGSSLLHPAYLDGCFQLLVNLLAGEESPDGVAFVPVKLRRLILDRAGREAVFAEARVRRRNTRSILADFALFDGEGERIAELRDVRLRAVPQAGGEAHGFRRYRYRAIPKPRPEAGAARLSLETLAAAAGERLHDPGRADLVRRYYEEVEPLLDALWAAFAESALRPLGGSAPGGDSRLRIGRGQVAPGSEPLLRILENILLEDGILEKEPKGLRWVAGAGMPDPREIWTSLLADYPDFGPEILRVGRIGMHLPEWLTGGPGYALGVQDGTETAAAATPALVALVEAAAAGLAQGERLQVLEFHPGAGHPACLEALSHLDAERCAYALASPSAAWLEEHRRLLERFPNLELVRYDPEQPETRPAAESRGPFDLVLVPAGLSAAREPGSALAGLGDLLAAEGVLVVAERQPSRGADVLAAVAALAPDGHPAARLHALPYWQEAFQSLGFSEPTVVPELPGIEAGFSLLAARAPGRQAAEPGAAGFWLLLRDAEGLSGQLGSALAGEITSRGGRVLTATTGSGCRAVAEGEFVLDPGSPDDLLEFLATARERWGSIEGVVHLAGLQPAAADADAALDLGRVAERCQGLSRLLLALEQAGVSAPCWLLTAGAGLPLLPESARRGLPADAAGGGEWAVAGYARTLINEHPELPVRWLDCTDLRRPERLAADLARELLEPDGEDEIILAAGGRYCPRLRAVPAEGDRPPAEAGPGPALRLDFPPGGGLKNLGWKRAPLPALAADEIEIETRTAGLNFRDVMYAMGILSDEAVENGFAGPTLGMELAGVVVAVGAEADGFAPGDEVIAFAPASLSTRVVTKAGSAVAKPSELSFEAAATIPAAFFTAYYALHHLARLGKGETVLIHGAAGGVGIAAIQLAKLAGAEIFATAGSERKRDFLRLLGVDHVLDSRSLAFADQVLALTGGRGLDVVLNSLAGEAMRRSLKVLRPFGRFLELGKRDFYENTRVGLRPFRNNIAYFGIDADQLMTERPDLTRRLFTEMMDLFGRGSLRPLPYTAFPARDVVEAFRYMQQSRQIGKVVVSFRDGAPAAAGPGRARGPLRLPAAAAYLVTGGLSGFGLRTAEWLAAKGAANLVLVSRSGRVEAGEEARLEALRELGINVLPAACDVADRGQVDALLAKIAGTLPPLRGIVHSAAVVEDGLARNTSPEQLRRVLAPKILGALHLDRATRGLELDFFIFHSSATTLFGNPGQGAYVAANSFLEGLAASRRSRGLPALCVRWGAIGDTGFLARNPAVLASLQSHLGAEVLTADAALDALERLLLEDCSDLAVLNLDWPAVRRFLPSSGAPKYRDIARLFADTGGEAGTAEQIRHWLEEKSDAELAVLFGELLKKEIGQILRIPPESLEDHRSIHDLGMDSLMGTELILAVEGCFGVRLPALALSEGPTIARLVERLIRQLRAQRAEAAPAEGGDSPAEQLQQVFARHTGEEDQAELRKLHISPASSSGNHQDRSKSVSS